MDDSPAVRLAELFATSQTLVNDARALAAQSRHLRRDGARRRHQRHRGDGGSPAPIGVCTSAGAIGAPVEWPHGELIALRSAVCHRPL